MSSTGETRLGGFCRRIDAALARVGGGAPAHVGRQDFPVVLGWLHDDVPVEVVERAIDEVAKRQAPEGPVRIRVAYLDRDVRRINNARRRRVGPGGGEGAGGRVRNCPRQLGGCGALDRGDEDRCVHCGWRRP